MHIEFDSHPRDIDQQCEILESLCEGIVRSHVCEIEAAGPDAFPCCVKCGKLRFQPTGAMRGTAGTSRNAPIDEAGLKALRSVIEHGHPVSSQEREAIEKILADHIVATRKVFFAEEGITPDGDLGDLSELAAAGIDSLRDGRVMLIATYREPGTSRTLRLFATPPEQAGGPNCTWTCPTGETCACNQACKCSGVDAHGVPGHGAECECMSLQTPQNRGSSQFEPQGGGAFDAQLRRAHVMGLRVRNVAELTRRRFGNAIDLATFQCAQERRRDKDCFVAIDYDPSGNIHAYVKYADGTIKDPQDDAANMATARNGPACGCGEDHEEDGG